MINREKKVLKGLEYCIESVAKACPEECPYIKECYHESFMYMPMRDALSLLKEQQETIVSLQHTINALNKGIAEQQKQRFFVDSDGKITPLPIQKHGRWIDCDYGEWKCSACNDSWYLEVGDPEHNEMNYCPMCGAKMDEEVKQDADD